MPSRNLNINYEQLRRRCDPTIFEFEGTADIPVLDATIGQDRAASAIDFGINIASPGYHIFVMGPGGTGKTTMVMSILTQKSSTEAVPTDWCYVTLHDAGNSVTMRMFFDDEGRLLTCLAQRYGEFTGQYL